MWRPGFAYEEARTRASPATGAASASTRCYHRGTPERPGLVLGLDRGGACEGIAYRMAAAMRPRRTRYLRAREQVNGVYREAHVPVRADRGRAAARCMALTYIVERAHPNYAGRLPLAEQARLIRGATGRSGTNLDYLISTLRHLAELGIRERELERLLAMIGPHAARLRQPEGRARMRRPSCAWHSRAPPARRAKLPKGDRRFLYRLHFGFVVALAIRVGGGRGRRATGSRTASARRHARCWWSRRIAAPPRRRRRRRCRGPAQPRRSSMASRVLRPPTSGVPVPGAKAGSRLSTSKDT